MSNSLLPPSATAQERAIELTSAQRIAAIPVPIREVWNPDTCPEYLLPWLAWAFSVDSWDPTWTETQKRNIIKNSVQIHKFKGTIGAVRRALESIGYSWKIVEWFEQDPPGIPHTFRIEIGITDVGIDDARYNSITKLVMDAKNVRSQLSTMLVHGDVKGNIYVAIGMLSGCEDDIYPYYPSNLEHTSEFKILSVCLDGEITFILSGDSNPEDYANSEIWSGETGVIDSSAFTLDGAYPDGGIGVIDQTEYEIVGIP